MGRQLQSQSWYVKIVPYVVGIAIIYVIYLIYRLMYLSFNPYQKETFRNDSAGEGHFGAPRGNRKHNGVDLIANVNDYAFAPFDAVITKLGQVYTNPNTFKYVELQGIGLLSVFKMRIMYVNQSHDRPIKVKDKVIKGQQIGRVQNIAGYHGNGMQNHIHVELRLLGKLIDPTPFIKTS